MHALNRSGRTALMEAAKYGEAAVAALLLSAGFDIEAQDPLGNTAFCMASDGGHKAIAAMLIAAGNDPQAISGRATLVAQVCQRAGYFPRACIASLLHGEGQHMRDMTWQFLQQRVRRCAVVRWRVAVLAGKDASMVFRAAAEGRPLELAKRLGLGAKAGGLEAKGVLPKRMICGEKEDGGSVYVMSERWTSGPLMAAVLGGHGECVKLLVKAWKRKLRPLTRHQLRAAIDGLVESCAVRPPLQEKGVNAVPGEEMLARLRSQGEACAPVEDLLRRCALARPADARKIKKRAGGGKRRAKPGHA